VHVELAPGVVTVLPVWKLDAAYYADLKVGAPQVSLARLYTNPRGRLTLGDSQSATA
jgi:hypothetical protein